VNEIKFDTKVGVCSFMRHSGLNLQHNPTNRKRKNKNVDCRKLGAWCSGGGGARSEFQPRMTDLAY
jgi:hypothetical protein